MVATPANALNISVTGIISFNGTATFTSSPTTNHGVVIGQANQAITCVGPTATSGQVLQGNGSSADPTYSTATYPTSTTANRILYSSATSVIDEITAVANGVLVANNSSVPSWLANDAGKALTANSGAPPSWQVLPSASGASTMNVQVFTSSGTYTPTSGMKYCIVECLGAGGGGGGPTGGASSSSWALGAGGGGGEYARACFSAATVGASKTITIGAAGARGAPGTGGAGGTTSMSTNLTAVGGSGGGTRSDTSQVMSFADGGAGGTGGTSSSPAGAVFRCTGSYGCPAFGAIITGVSSWCMGGDGGRTFLGGGPKSVAKCANTSVTQTFNGNYGQPQTGAGGSGGCVLNSTGSAEGGNGGVGVVIITEII